MSRDTVRLPTKQWHGDEIDQKARQATQHPQPLEGSEIKPNYAAIPNGFHSMVPLQVAFCITNAASASASSQGEKKRVYWIVRFGHAFLRRHKSNLSLDNRRPSFLRYLPRANHGRTLAAAQASAILGCPLHFMTSCEQLPTDSTCKEETATPLFYSPSFARGLFPDRQYCLARDPTSRTTSSACLG